MGIRAEQLNAATKLDLWQLAFESAEELHTVISHPANRKAFKSKVMMMYVTTCTSIITRQTTHAYISSKHAHNHVLTQACCAVARQRITRTRRMLLQLTRMVCVLCVRSYRYYDKLSQVFWVSENYMFHACAMQKIFNLTERALNREVCAFHHCRAIFFCAQWSIYAPHHPGLKLSSLCALPLISVGRRAACERTSSLALHTDDV